MKIKRILSVLLIIACLFSCCSFSVSAEEIPLTDFNIILSKEVTEGSTTTTYNFSYTVSEDNNFYFVKPIDKENFWTGQAAELCNAFKFTNLEPAHEYLVKFKCGTTFSSPCEVKVILGGECLYKGNIGSYNGSVSFKFTSPDVIRENTTFSIVLKIGVPQYYVNGSFVISKNIEFEDLTENPSWLRKILNAFSDIGTTLSNSFNNLTQSISNFFSDFTSNWNAGIDAIKGKIKDFSDSLNNKLNSMWQTITEIKTTIQNKIEDLKNSIKEFFTMLKNYLLYFQHPVTLNSDGVLIGADGQPVYTNPFANALNKVEDTVYGWLNDISNFLDGIDESRQNVSEYLKNGSTFIDGIFKISPILSVCVAFAVAFLVIRKVVGR